LVIPVVTIQDPHPAFLRFPFAPGEHVYRRMAPYPNRTGTSRFFGCVTGPSDPQPTWIGYSVGRWDGDALVVDAAGFTERTRLDVVGRPHSEALHVQERFHRRDFGHMNATITIDDPVMYTRPFTVKATEVLLPDNDVLETICNENEKDQAHSK